MGKASTAKKVQRAARAGGKTSGKQRQLGFPVAIAAVVIIGLSLVTYTRASGQLGADAKNPPKVGEHWHAAYGIYICDHFVTNVSDRSPDVLGIHTHDDGLVHIHPFTNGAAGKQATFARFFDQTGLKVTNSEIKLPSAAPFKGRTYKEGSTTCNGKPATIQVYHWKSAVNSATGIKADKVFTKDFSKIRFTEDLGAFTFAFVPAGTKVPPPPEASEILSKATIDQSPTPTQADTSTSAPTATGATTPASTPATSAATTPGSTAAPPATDKP